MTISALEKELIQRECPLPSILKKGLLNCTFNQKKTLQSQSNPKEIQELFPNTHCLPLLKLQTSVTQTQDKPLKVGVILSGGQASGGHNVIAGVYDALQNIHSESILYGFKKGPSGLENGEYNILDKNKIASYRNTGGFNIIGSGRTKLETTKQFDRCIQVSKKLNLDAIIIIGGDDSNTNASILAEYYQSKSQKTIIIGIPKTIDGDLKNEYIPISFGFDTACKTYSELVGNIARDACSAQKYWHFIKLMGRSASHITLEVGLQTQPNITLISEEIKHKKMSLDSIVDSICEVIIDRSKNGKDYGIILIPEGLIEFIDSINKLITELNQKLLEHQQAFNQTEILSKKIELAQHILSPQNATEFSKLPNNIQSQLLLDRDPHGNVQVSRIETESLLIQLVKKNLKNNPNYTGSFAALNHFFGYEGRSAFPSIFDSNYTYTLGYASINLILAKATGYMISIQNILANIEHWEINAVPVTSMLNLELRYGENKPVIKKALVDLDGPVFKYFKNNRSKWKSENQYLFPGSIQYYGSTSNLSTLTLELEHRKE